MFSEYASRLVQQSHLRLVQPANRPLFHSTSEDREDIRESMALRQSRAGIASRFGLYQALEDSAEEDALVTDDHDAMRSSWIPPKDRRTPAQTILLASMVGTANGSRLAETDAQDRQSSDESVMHSDANDESDTESQHSEAPDDIMFGVPLADSIPPQSLAGSIALDRPDLRPGKQKNSRRPMDHVSLDESMENSLPSMQKSTTPDILLSLELAPVHHDRGFAILFMIAQASIWATSFFIYLRNDVPSSPMTDTIYSALINSMGVITRDVFLAVGISILWLLSLRTCVKPVLYCIMIGVPLVLSAFSIYILAWSYKGQYGGNELQARAMRWSSLLTAIFAALWTHSVYTKRYALTRSIGLIKLACSILAQNVYLLGLSFFSMTFFVTYTYLWLLQFERIFLRGTFQSISGVRQWIMEGNSWLLGAYFAIVYLWTLSVANGVQRAATSAVVSHWYFHRHKPNSLPGREIAKAGLLHALSASFGSICAATLFSLLSRLPILALPRRLSGFISLTAYMLLSAPLFNLTNALTLTYAAMHSIDIFTAARSVNLQNNLNPAYRTSKLLLSAARATTALSLGTAAWISSARAGNNKSSLYGYAVGLVAASIGWSVVGAVEGMVSMIVDSAFVNYTSDLRNAREGRSHCLEAVEVFGSSSRNDGMLQV